MITREQESSGGGVASEEVRCLLSSLRRDGYAILHSPRGDRSGATLLNIVCRIGTPTTHNDGGKVLWRISPQVQSTETSTTARSHTADEFSLHTDASFEDPPPSHFALYVVQSDKFGGGLNYFVRVSDVLSQLTNDQKHALRTTRFHFVVPPEFRKDSAHIDLSVLFGNNQMRYRLEQMRCLSSGDVRLLTALVEAIERAQRHWITLSDGDLLIMDNSRLLHARTAVRDPNRELLRVRFNLNESLL